MEMDIDGLVPFSAIDPGKLFAAPILGSLRLCLRAASLTGGNTVVHALVIAPAIEPYDGSPGIITADNYGIDACIVVSKTSVSPDLSSVTESGRMEAGAFVIAGADGYLIVKLNQNLRAVRLSDGAIMKGNEIPSPFVVVPKWSIVRAVPFAPPRPIFTSGTNKMTL